MNYIQGSLWNKWDLHVHTPASIVGHFGGDTDATWNKYILALEKLPPEIKVIGVNDYIFIDGYRKLLDAQKKGRLKNIDLLLPVIELRLKEFGGTNNKLSRVNFHVIFSEQLSPDVIEQQFINGLKTKYLISPKYAQVTKTWSSIPTKESLKDLGELIIASVPKDQVKNFGSPLVEGFNNLNFTYEHVQGCLQNEIFKGKFITAVGKTEWSDVKWSESSIAEKKNIVNSVDCVFISSYSDEDFYRSKDHLTASNVNDKLIDCSDAHYYEDSKEKDRLGKCLSWIKADTTFEGLRQALFEYEERIFTGAIPPKMKAVNSSKTKYLKSVSVKKLPASKFKEHWFDSELDLNYGLVSIIGNKGGGKSAFADILGLLGNSRNEEWFSFLTEKKFRKTIDGKAEHFQASLTWMSEDINQVNLAHKTNSSGIEAIKYIPQNFFEEICNELGDIEESQFDKEIKKVIYSHVPKTERLKLSTLDAIIDLKTRETYQAIDKFREQIQRTNRDYDLLEEKYTEENRTLLNSRLKEKNKELESHNKNKPKVIAKPTQKDVTLTEQIDDLNAQRQALVNDQQLAEERLAEVNEENSDFQILIEMLENLEKDISAAAEDFNSAAENVGIKFEKIFKYSVNRQPIQEKIAVAEKEKKELQAKLKSDGDKSIGKSIAEIDKKLTGFAKKLDKPQQDYQSYLKAFKEWEKQEKEIVGNKKVVGSLEYLNNELNELEGIPDKLLKLHEKRIGYAKNIFKNLSKVCDIYKSLYKPVQDFISNHPDIKDKGALSFDVSVSNLGFQEEFFDRISRGATGSFYGTNEGAKVATDIIAKYDFNNQNHVMSFIEELLTCLTIDQKNAKSEKISIKSQLKKGKSVSSLYDFLFSLTYLRPRYVLKMGEKELGELSPGERGTLLLIFYLLVDNDDVPLIIDQPEHNLDNQTVYRVLVPAIKRAKTRRQVIIVTHNPNLAVVCNSDQIIYASLNIKDNHRVSYVSGAIENPEINKILVDILEGTWPAFDYRNNIYIHQDV